MLVKETGRRLKAIKNANVYVGGRNVSSTPADGLDVFSLSSAPSGDCWWWH